MLVSLRCFWFCVVASLCCACWAGCASLLRFLTCFVLVGKVFWFGWGCLLLLCGYLAGLLLCWQASAGLFGFVMIAGFDR